MQKRKKIIIICTIISLIIVLLIVLLIIFKNKNKTIEKENWIITTNTIHYCPKDIKEYWWITFQVVVWWSNGKEYWTPDAACRDWVKYYCMSWPCWETDKE